MVTQKEVIDSIAIKINPAGDDLWKSEYGRLYTEDEIIDLLERGEVLMLPETPKAKKYKKGGLICGEIGYERIVTALEEAGLQ